jgi:DivIVA domain-containing protein
MNGDEVRATRFASTPVRGYDASEVDDLLDRVATEVDSGRSPGPAIGNAAFRPPSVLRAIPLTLAGAPPPPPYDIDAVDWFFGQLSPSTGQAGLADAGADPWRDLTEAQLIGGVGGAPAKPSVAQLLELDKVLDLNEDYVQDCQNAWRQFGRQAGVYLREGESGHLWAPRHEVRTGEQKTIASRDTNWKAQATVRVGEKSFTYQKSTSGPPVIAEIAARSARDYAGQFTAGTMSGPGQEVHQLVDEAGTPILYVSGKNYDRRACACVTFPDQRWLRFLVRGTKPENAIMTAVDQAGNRVARYRQLADDLDPGGWGEVVITVHPDLELTDELLLAIVISTGWLDSYFNSPNSGGGARDVLNWS